MNVLAIDIGGTHVKLLVTGQKMHSEFASCHDLTPTMLLAGVRRVAKDWKYDAVAFGYPGPVCHIVDTHNWWPGKKVLIAPEWIERVSWGERKVFVNLDRETIEQSPEYTEASLITRDYEIGLHGHYNRKGYWVDELVNS